MSSSLVRYNPPQLLCCLMNYFGGILQKLLVVPLVATALFSCCHPQPIQASFDKLSESTIEAQAETPSAKISIKYTSDCHKDDQQKIQVARIGKHGEISTDPTEIFPYDGVSLHAISFLPSTTQIPKTGSPFVKNTQAFLGVYRS